MGADSDDDSCYCFYGTAIADEIESKGGSYRKPVQDQASTRALPIWQQEPTDEQGRKRFHGGDNEVMNSCPTLGGGDGVSRQSPLNGMHGQKRSYDDARQFVDAINQDYCPMALRMGTHV